MRTILVTGAQGVGKSTVTCLAAQALGLEDWDYADLMMRVERAMQRRTLELLVVAAGLGGNYERIIEAVVERNSYMGPVVASDLTREELGEAAGVRRAGCIGLLRGSRHVSL